jgi:hypothetical protein
MNQPLDPCVSDAGPATYLRYNQEGWSWDRRQNRLCQSCRCVLTTQPSDEIHHATPTRRRLTPDDSAAVG